MNLAFNALCGLYEDYYGKIVGQYDAVGIEGIANSIANSSSLTSIDLRGNRLGPEGAKALAPALRESPITSIGKDGLNLKGNKLGNEGWEAIFAAICTSEASKITSIDASGDRIGPECAQLIGQALRDSANPSITVVDLRYNCLDTESATTLATIAKEKGISLCGITPEQT